MEGLRIPSAIPQISLPMIIIATPLAAVWNTAPTIVNRVEIIIVYLRPNFSRVSPQSKEPTAEPVEDMATIAPRRLEAFLVPGGNMKSLKESCAITVAMIPVSIPITAPPREIAATHSSNRSWACIMKIHWKHEMVK